MEKNEILEEVGLMVRRGPIYRDKAILVNENSTEKVVPEEETWRTLDIVGSFYAHAYWGDETHQKGVTLSTALTKASAKEGRDLLHASPLWHLMERLAHNVSLKNLSSVLVRIGLALKQTHTSVDLHEVANFVYELLNSPEPNKEISRLMKAYYRELPQNLNP